VASGSLWGASVPQFEPIDLFAFSWFLLCWVGYTLYSDRAAAKGDNLVGAMARQRELWMHQMVGRDNRMVDIQIVRAINRNSTFFASTSMLILAGLLTVLGATDKAVRMVATVPLVSELTLLQWETRLVGMVLIFVYTFFKFSWSIRQLSYCAILIGAMTPSTKADEDCIRRSDNIARVATLAALHFNRGLRGYYFAAALSASFIHPVALIVTASWVVMVLYRREFRSRTRTILEASEGPAAGVSDG
jgi:uncharacterized membrane protein